MKRLSIQLFSLFLLVPALALAQPDRWQQGAAYTMDIDFDVEKHQFTGKQTLVYTNNSPDTLRRAFYHLYFNAFQPGSMMDVRSRSIEDPDRRVRDRISMLSEDEIGYQKVLSLTQNGKAASYKEVGTILEVELPEPIMPNSTATFEMEFKGQVPLQIRRSGRDNKEGISYSMTQWYPKMSEYDYEGWHANPYIGREFHGIWGSYDVTINIDKDYVVGGTGVLQNPEQIGHGYDAGKKKVKQKVKDGKLSWHFKANRVHDFAWAADPDYHHRYIQVPNGPTVHFFYQKGEDTKEWDNKRLDEDVISHFQIMDSTFGKYPFEAYSILQGGDGGMEYPMATLITGHRSYGSLLGVIIHEANHSWYQMVLGTNESKYPWMDEGFTSYTSNYVESKLAGEPNSQISSLRGYLAIATSPKAEPLTVHADHYKTNRAYGLNSYSKGATTLVELSYILGEEVMLEGMRNYFNTWKFKHPNPNDFKRIMEKTSGLELDWFFEHWVGTINTIDYGVKNVETEDGTSYAILERVGDFPMPLDVYVEYKDGTKAVHYIPLRIMRGEKENEYPGIEWKVEEDWPWVYPEYRLKLDKPGSEVKRIVIDPSGRLADVEPSNNQYPASGGGLQFGADE